MKLKKLLFVMTAIAAATLAFTACEASEPNENVDTESGLVSAFEEGGVPENISGITSPNSFTADTLDGGEYTADNFSQADVTVINIWALTCGPCLEEMPEIAEYTKTLPDNVKLITWCLDGGSDVEYTKEVLSSSGYDGITIIGGDGDLKKMLGDIMYTPTTLCVDSKGNIIGDALIGSPYADIFSETYTDFINQALKAIGKEEMK